MRKVNFFQLPIVTIKLNEDINESVKSSKKSRINRIRSIKFSSWCDRANSENEKLQFKAIFKAEA